MPSKFNSTAKKPGKAVKKPYNRGGRTAADMAGRNTGGGRRGAALSQARLGAMATNRPSKRPPAGAIPLVSRNKGGKTNLRDEEARVIGVQDNAADEMRRVKARRPKDAAERRDKRSQLSRVGSRERNARDEMKRLRGEAARMGMKKGGKTQGYNDKLDESLGSRNKTKGKQSLKSRRKESEGMEKAAGKRKYSAVGTMDKSGSSKKKASKKAAPKKKAGLSNKINQHKRMAMGEDVLTGKMIKKKRGGRTASDSAKSKAAHSKSSHKYFAGASQNPKRVGRTIKKAGGKVANTAVRLNMGAPKVRTVKARGMGAAIKGGQFRENT
jgi:hypothetical protein